MPSLQKKYEKELRKSAEYIPQSRFWLVMIFLLVIVIGIVISEILTRGRIDPMFEGGWLTYIISEICRVISEFIAMVVEALLSFHY